MNSCSSTTNSAPIEFTIPGAAAPQGSKRAIRLRTGRTVLVESSAKVKPFRAVAALVAGEVDLFAGGASLLMPQAQAGKVKLMQAYFGPGNMTAG